MFREKIKHLTTGNHKLILDKENPKRYNNGSARMGKEMVHV